MKKRFFSIIAIVSFISILGMNLLEKPTKESANDMLLSNIEALASGESGGTLYQTMAYCSSRIELACTRTVYAYRCSSYHCIV